jgi:hypothetical protein
VKPLIFWNDSCYSKDDLFAEQDQQVSIHLDTVYLEDTTPFRVFLSQEPVEVHNILPKVIENQKFFHLILGWDEDFLKQCLDSVLVFSPALWCGSFYLGTVSYRRGMENSWITIAGDIDKKDYIVSFLTSDKHWCPGHILRHEVYNNLPESVGDLKIQKHRSPPFLESKICQLENSQYHIVIENASHNNYFTEKILDSFAMKSLPLYWGCPNLSKFFNMDGVIRFETYEELVKCIQGLTPSYYEEHRQAVEDNYKLALQYKEYFPRVDSEIAKKLAGWTQNESTDIGSVGAGRIISERTIIGQRIRRLRS